jgi:outer membrane protein insertion porin family
LRAGTVLGSRLDITGSSAPTFIPLQERLYAGGPNSVRGFRQNEMGPAIYIPRDFSITTIPGDDTLQYWRANPDSVGDRTVPTGGDNVIVANAEIRLRSPAYPELVQYALFVDAGQVWNRGRAGTGVNFADIRVTPGVGLRVFTPVGPLRVDVGYNPYRRPAGPAYITDLSGNLICVSPGNTLRVRIAEDGQPARQIDDGDCPASYAPRLGTSFLNRLTFQFSIGQPF